MSEISNDSTDIQDSDIIFDCPYCGKSLAIDYRGAGLGIECSDCGEDVIVPIPEGMELSDVDSSDEDQEMRILNLRKLLANAELKIDLLESELEEVSNRRDELERYDAMGRRLRKVVNDSFGIVDKSLKEALSTMDKLKDATKDDGTANS